MKMQKQECSKNGGFRKVQISIFTGSQLLTLELFNSANTLLYAWYFSIMSVVIAEL